MKKIVLCLLLALSGFSGAPALAATQLYANNAVTTLAANASSGTTSLTVASSAAFPALSGGNWFVATLEHIVSGIVTAQEIVKVTAVSGTTWTVVRAQEGTSAAAWVSGDTIALLPTAGGLANFAQVTGNIATATALASTPTQCSSSNAATGIAANGNANCASNIATATALAATPTQCAAGYASTGIAASGNANCGVQTSLLAPLASPALTGAPTAPTATSGDSSTLLADTAFVNPNSHLVQNGYRTNPDGSIYQWGVCALSPGNTNCSFPTAFPNHTWNVQYSLASGNIGSPASGIVPAGLFSTYFTIYISTSSNIYWFAIGN